MKIAFLRTAKNGDIPLVEGESAQTTRLTLNVRAAADDPRGNARRGTAREDGHTIPSIPSINISDPNSRRPWSSV